MRLSVFLARVGLLVLLLGGCTEWEPGDTPPRQVRQQVVVPPSFSDTRVARGLSSPTSLAIAPDGRLFVCEQGGTLRVIQDGVLLPEPFLAVDVDSDGERGLLGVALDPGFPAQPYVYIYYTATAPEVHNRVSRFTASGNRAVPGSELVLLDLDPLSSSINHNGGALQFGGDGKLYVAVGDNTRPSNAQTLGNLHGKLLRLNKDGTLPTDNPFYGTAEGNRRAIWALGLRNPFSFAVQPGTGRLFINDVGAESWEEINEGVPGGNYGWPVREGPSDDPRYRSPVYAYLHGVEDSRGCAITGGTFYNPSMPRFPAEYLGDYFFADYCNGWIRTLDLRTNTTMVFARELDAVVDLDVGPDGSLYYLDRGEEAVHRIRYMVEGAAPVITSPPASLRVAPGQSATFTVVATGATPLGYQWLRDGVALPGETAASLTLEEVGPEDSGARFRVRVSNVLGSVLSEEALLTVQLDTPPVAVLLTPPAGTSYQAGDLISFEGRGTDAEDGALAGSAFTWRIDFHHDDHLHPFVPPIGGMVRGTFTAPDTGETSANTWYRIHLRVTDSNGNSHAVFRDVHPRKVKLRLETQPPGLEVTLDGQLRAAPQEVEGVVGMLRTLGTESLQVKDGVTYVFERWLHGGERIHDIRTPATDTVYTAVFRPADGPGGTFGLRAEYFGAPNLTDPRFERVDPTVDFRWDWEAPEGLPRSDFFSVRWSGSVVPRYSETYTFYTQSNDGVRLWVDGQLLIDHWTLHSTREDRGSLPLEAGRAYSVRMEFFENRGMSTARLLWSSPRQRKQVIPADQLRPVPPPTSSLSEARPSVPEEEGSVALPQAGPQKMWPNSR